MTTLNNKAEIALLIKNPAFHDLLDIDTPEAFLQRSRELPNQQFEYHAGKWDEEGTGVELFKTPRRANQWGKTYGTWLTVAKVYGDADLPFCVQAAEYVPWGIDVDVANLGSFKTLGEALDVAFMAHEHGTIEIDRSDRGLDEPLISIPAITDLSNEAQLVNFVVEDLSARRQERLAQKQEQSRAKQIRYDVPINLRDAPALLNRIRDRLAESDIRESHDSQVHLAASINKHLFADQGYLFDCYNTDLRSHEVLVDGAVFVAIQAGAELVYYNADGVFREWSDAEAAMIKNLGKIYKPQMSDLGGDRLTPVCWFEDSALKVNLDVNALTPIIEVPEIDLGEDCPDGALVPAEIAVARIVRDVAHEYKVAREKRLQQALEAEGLSL
jgi:hypothetical protein